jgi:hypothetical protein
VKCNYYIRVTHSAVSYSQGRFALSSHGSRQPSRPISHVSASRGRENVSLDPLDYQQAVKEEVYAVVEW